LVAGALGPLSWYGALRWIAVSGQVFMSFALNILSVLGARIVIIVLSFAGSIVVTRILGPSDRGAMEILLLIPYMLVNLAHLGIGNANLYFIGKKEKPIERVVGNSLSVSLLLGMTLIAVGYCLFFYYQESMFKGITLSYMHIVFPLIPFLLVQKYTQYTLLGQEDINSRNTLVLFPAITNFLIVMALVAIIPLRVFGVLIAQLVSNGVTVLLCLYYLSKRTTLRPLFDSSLFIDSVKFGMVPFLALMVMNLNFKVTVFLIKYFMDNTAVGLYSVAVSVVDKITLIPEVIGLVLFSRISNATEQEANHLTPIVCRLSIALSVIMGFLLLVSAELFVPFVYGKEFSGSVTALLLLIPGIVFMTFFMILHGDLTGRGKAILTLYIFTIALLVNIALNLFLIPLKGINGAALATTFSYSFGSILLALTFSRQNGVSLRSLIFPTRGDFLLYMVPLAARLKAKLTT
jgi:O-antigen/teichoic acid export membrane protein